jgi:anti-anti-sigma factor
VSIVADIERMDGAVIVALTGRLDSGAAPSLDQALSPLVEPDGRLVLDLTKLDFVSSAGLRIFLKTAKQAKAARAGMALCGLNDSVRDVFEISGFMTIFAVHADRAEALAALA